MNQISRAKNGKLYIAAEAGNLYRSEDNGATWEALTSPYEGSFYGVLPQGNDEVLAYGLRGNAFLSKDAGDSWERLETGTKALLINATRLPNNGVAIVGANGTVLFDKDCKQTKLNLVTRKGQKDLTAVLPLDSKSVLLIGDGVTEKLSFGMVATK
jgi:photosystem II stability/assembly factor-like uncharacterized protein